MESHNTTADYFGLLPTLDETLLLPLVHSPVVKGKSIGKHQLAHQI
jgi:hypothetical protein